MSMEVGQASTGDAVFCVICGTTNLSQVAGLYMLYMCDQCAEKVVRGRNNYIYPAAYVSVRKGVGDQWLTGKQFSIKFNGMPNEQYRSSVALDHYHCSLLSSQYWYEVVAGLASVIYWGFFAGLDGRPHDNRARTRVGWFLNGRKGNSPLNFDQTVNVIVTARKFMANRQIGDALGEISKIGELGQVSFASKAVAFLDPTIAGIYDRRIFQRVSQEAKLMHLSMNPNQGGITYPKRIRYQQWCDYCFCVAYNMSEGIKLGKPWEWTDWDGATWAWRAVDVERALFMTNITDS